MLVSECVGVRVMVFWREYVRSAGREGGFRGWGSIADLQFLTHRHIQRVDIALHAYSFIQSMS